MNRYCKWMYQIGRIKAYTSHTESIKFLCGLCYTEIICIYQKCNYIYKHNESRRKIAVHVKKRRFMPKGF